MLLTHISSYCKTTLTKTSDRGTEERLSPHCVHTQRQCEQETPRGWVVFLKRWIIGVCFCEGLVAAAKEGNPTLWSCVMRAAVGVLISLLLISHCSRAQKPGDDSVHSSSSLLLSPPFFFSFLLLGLTVILSGSVYLWILRYVCIGCCQPVAVGVESEALDGVV